jgi:beta-fructofuranosidase
MPSVPEILLRKLYVPASLKTLADGFAFQLNNILLAVSVAGLSVSADETKISASDLYLQFSGQAEHSAEELFPTGPLLLPLQQVLTVRARSANFHPRKLRIEAQTVEMGLLAFSIDLRAGKGNRFSGSLRKAADALKTVFLAQKVKRDPQHPIYHFSPPANWMNDPNGLVSWQGKTHLFYQYNPSAPVWGKICWGHAVSTDLVHWQRLPIALWPHSGQPDQDGCWSGSALMTEDGPLFFYTGVFPESVCLAKPDMAFRKLEPVEGNPVIAAPPSGLSVEGFRDPCVWKEGDRWYLTLGSGIKGKGGVVFLYESTDLQHWRYLHPLLQGDSQQNDPFPTGDMWECPQLIELGGEYFLFISARVAPGTQYSFYFQGKMQDHCFIPSDRKYLDHGLQVYYAPLSFLDDTGRRVVFGWLSEERSEEAACQAGWAGVMSLPRLFTLSAQKELLVDPLPELESLRQGLLNSFTGPLTASPFDLDAGNSVRNAEMEAEIIAADGGKAALVLAEKPDSAERTLITLDFDAGLLSLDTRASSRSPLCPGSLKEAPLAVKPGEPLEIRLFIDGSVLELYVGHRVVISSRFYPARMDSLHLCVRGEGAEVLLKGMKLWRMGHF